MASLVIVSVDDFSKPLTIAGNILGRDVINHILDLTWR